MREEFKESEDAFVFRALGRRWSKIMIAVGVVTGTILSFEFGLLWPGVARLLFYAFEWSAAIG